MIHPALEPFLLAARTAPPPHPSTQNMEDRRSAYREFAEELRGDVEPMEAVTNLELALPGRTLQARLYVPSNDEHNALVVYFHGGGFVVGDLNTHDSLCRRLSADSGMRFLSVEYRLAPEHPFPAAIDDAVDVVREIVGRIGEFAHSSARVVVMGDSAGATLATIACALTNGDGLAIAAQVIIYPTLGPELLTDSVHKFGVGHLLDTDHLRHDYELYLGSWCDHTDPRVSPLMFSDLSGAPPAIVLVAECDPLRDEGVAYAGLLEHFGVRVELLEAEGMVHGFLRLGTMVPEVQAIVDDLAGHLHRFVQEPSA